MGLRRWASARRSHLTRPCVRPLKYREPLEAKTLASHTSEREPEVITAKSQIIVLFNLLYKHNWRGDRSQQIMTKLGCTFGSVNLNRILSLKT